MVAVARQLSIGYMELFLKIGYCVFESASLTIKLHEFNSKEWRKWKRVRETILHLRFCDLAVYFAILLSNVRGKNPQKPSTGKCILQSCSGITVEISGANKWFLFVCLFLHKWKCNLLEKLVSMHPKLWTSLGLEGKILPNATEIWKCGL